MADQKTAPSPLIQIQELSCYYASRNFGFFGKKEIKPVLHKVNMDIAAGEIFGLSGESGCGKTTLARCILGLIDYDGEITINGEKQQAGRYSVRRMRLQAGNVQMIFQNPGASLNPAKKIGWLLEEPLAIQHRGTKPERAFLVDEMLVRVGLDPSFKKRRIHELSGGQKQRVCIGRTLMLNPKIIIADEAISSLDISAGAQILNLFQELSETLGLSILFISHDINVIEYLCGRIAVMQEGKIRAYL
ncbi:MAG: ATP-binding cassette domain-containing protein [Treponema sp.]|nr:ATP-binding cassette domain-containing protein [Treponema sp.]